MPANLNNATQPTHQKRWFWIVLILCVGGLCVPACSSDKSTSVSGEAALSAVVTKTQWVTETAAPVTVTVSPESEPSEVSSGAVANQDTEIPLSSEARTALETLPVKGRAPTTGYSRDQFGAAWTDVDHNGCDTRNDILTRDLHDVTYKQNTHNCVVLSGTLNDPYTGKSINFLRGQNTSSAVQIDHVVALSDAWQTGAQQWDTEKRTALANDPLNLLAVDGSANQQKSDGDASTWLPPNTSYRCDYVARQVAVKQKYGLWVTSAEKDAIARILDGCPNQALPSS